jgi:hypothetical protein
MDKHPKTKQTKFKQKWAKKGRGDAPFFFFWGGFGRFSAEMSLSCF